MREVLKEATAQCNSAALWYSRSTLQRSWVVAVNAVNNIHFVLLGYGKIVLSPSANQAQTFITNIKLLLVRERRKLYFSPSS